VDDIKITFFKSKGNFVALPCQKKLLYCKHVLQSEKPDVRTTSAQELKF